MIRLGRLTCVVVSTCMLAGCMLPTGAKKGTGSSLTREGSVRSGLGKGTVGKNSTISGSLKGSNVATNGAGVVSNNAAGIVSNNSGGVISNNAGSLSGDVMCPAGLISNNGGGIISNNGLGYRVASAGRYHVLGTVTESPLANVTVNLFDAAGNPVKDASGKQLTAKTDEKGHYSFEGILPANNLLVVVDLGDKGRLKAIATKSGGTKRTSDLSLISTLTTGYILDQYVKGQADPVTTLDKLPANIEAETRTKAAAAFAANGVAAPADLKPTSVVSTVTTMRSQSATFDAQMEEVKKLLIAAGQSDLGAGRPALEVSLNYVEQLYVSPTGELQIACGSDRRLWRIDSAGKIQNLAGKGVVQGGSLNGKAGPEAGLAYLLNTAQDAQGRVWLLEGPLVEEDDALPDAGRLNVLGTDGKLTEAWANVPPSAQCVVAGAGDEALVFLLEETADDSEEEYGEMSVWAVKPGQAPVKRGVFDAASTALVADNLMSATGDGQGNVYVVGYDSRGNERLMKMNAGTTTFTKVYSVSANDMSTLGAGGTLFLWKDNSNIVARKPDGTLVTLLDAPPNPDEGGSIDTGVLLPDGTAYLSFNTKVYKVVNKVATAVAGTGMKTATGKATEIAVKPSGMTIGTDGALYFTDEDNGFVMKLGSDGLVTQFAGSDDSDDDEPVDGSLAKDAPLFGADAIHADGAGNLYLTSFDVIYKIDTAGKIYKFYAVASEDESIDDFVVASDGSLFTVETYWDANDNSEVRLKRRAPGASSATLLKKDTNEEAGFVLCLDGAAVLVADNTNSKLCRWTAANGLQDVATDPLFASVYGGDLAIGKDGKLIVCDGGTNRILRYDTATKTSTVLAGKGGKLFTGNTVDTSFDYPTFPVVNAAGDIFVVDSGHRQIKKIPIDQQ